MTLEYIVGKRTRPAKKSTFIPNKFVKNSVSSNIIYINLSKIWYRKGAKEGKDPMTWYEINKVKSILYSLHKELGLKYNEMLYIKTKDMRYMYAITQVARLYIAYLNK